MGAAVVKGFEYATQREELMTRCIDDIRDNPEETELIIKACNRAHYYLSISFFGKARKSNQRTFGENGGVELILGILNNHKSEMVLRSACRLLSELALDERNAERLRLANAVELVDRVAKENDDDSYILDDVSKMKDRMVSSGTSLEKMIVAKAQKEKKLLPLFQSLHNQAVNKVIQLAALEAIWDVASDSTTLEQMNNDQFPFEFLMDSMKIHIEEKDIQLKALLALQVITKDEKVRSILGHGGIMVIIIRAIRTHLRCLELVQAGIWILKLYAKDEKSNLSLKEHKCGLVLRRCVRIAKEEQLGNLVLPLSIRRLMKSSIERGETESDDDWSDEFVDPKRRAVIRRKEQERERARLKEGQTEGETDEQEQ